MTIRKTIAATATVAVGAAVAGFGGLRLGQAPAGAATAAQPVKARVTCPVRPAVKPAAGQAVKRAAKRVFANHRRVAAAVHHGRPALRHQQTAAQQRSHTAKHVAIKNGAVARDLAVAANNSRRCSAVVRQQSNLRLHDSSHSCVDDGREGSHHGGHHGDH